MYISRHDELIKAILEEYNIPFSQQTISWVDKILYWTHSEFDSVEKFGVLVEYLKERDTKDIYGFSKDNPRFTGQMATDGWLYYLEHYAYYVSKVLKASGIHWLDVAHGKYLFPEDIYDVIYKYRENRGQIYLDYMIEKHPESMSQMTQYTKRLKELNK